MLPDRAPAHMQLTAEIATGNKSDLTRETLQNPCGHWVQKAISFNESAIWVHEMKSIK
jgi:hypothetical protein